MTAVRSLSHSLISVAATILFCGGAAAQARTAALAQGGTPVGPEFYRDVSPILQENCQACHRINGNNMGDSSQQHVHDNRTPMTLQFQNIFTGI